MGTRRGGKKHRKRKQLILNIGEDTGGSLPASVSLAFERPKKDWENYFHHVKKLLSCPATLEEKISLIRSSISQIIEKEILVLKDPRCSKVIEKILGLLVELSNFDESTNVSSKNHNVSENNIKTHNEKHNLKENEKKSLQMICIDYYEKLLNAISNQLSDLSVHPIASHVLQTLILSLPNFIHIQMKYDEEIKLQELFIVFLNRLRDEGGWIHLMMHPCATHVFRSSLLSLAGITTLQTAEKLGSRNACNSGKEDISRMILHYQQMCEEERGICFENENKKENTRFRNFGSVTAYKNRLHLPFFLEYIYSIVNDIFGDDRYDNEMNDSNKRLDNDTNGNYNRSLLWKRNNDGRHNLNLLLFDSYGSPSLQHLLFILYFTRSHSMLATCVDKILRIKESQLTLKTEMMKGIRNNDDNFSAAEIRGTCSEGGNVKETKANVDESTSSENTSLEMQKVCLELMNNCAGSRIFQVCILLLEKENFQFFFSNFFSKNLSKFLRSKYGIYVMNTCIQSSNFNQPHLLYLINHLDWNLIKRISSISHEDPMTATRFPLSSHATLPVTNKFRNYSHISDVLLSLINACRKYRICYKEMTKKLFDLFDIFLPHNTNYISQSPSVTHSRLTDDPNSYSGKEVKVHTEKEKIKLEGKSDNVKYDDGKRKNWIDFVWFSLLSMKSPEHVSQIIEHLKSSFQIRNLRQLDKDGVNNLEKDNDCSGSISFVSHGNSKSDPNQLENIFVADNPVYFHQLCTLEGVNILLSLLKFPVEAIYPLLSGFSPFLRYLNSLKIVTLDRTEKNKKPKQCLSKLLYVFVTNKWSYKIAEKILNPFTPLQERNRHMFLSSLFGSFLDLSLNKHGSFVITAAFNISNNEMRKRIVEELIDKEEELKSKNPLVYSKCEISKYKYNPDDWLQSQKMKSKTREIFKKILVHNVTEDKETSNLGTDSSGNELLNHQESFQKDSNGAKLLKGCFLSGDMQGKEVELFEGHNKRTKYIKEKEDFSTHQRSLETKSQEKTEKMLKTTLSFIGGTSKRGLKRRLQKAVRCNYRRV